MLVSPRGPVILVAPPGSEMGDPAPFPRKQPRISPGTWNLRDLPYQSQLSQQALWPWWLFQKLVFLFLNSPENCLFLGLGFGIGIWVQFYHSHVMFQVPGDQSFKAVAYCLQKLKFHNSIVTITDLELYLDASVLFGMSQVLPLYCKIHIASECHSFLQQEDAC